MARKKVLCFGELLLRISPANSNNDEKQPLMVYVGGAEANVATALAGWEVPVKYFTVLPDNFMARHMVDYLEYQGIYTSSIHYSGNRIGLYYLERGADLKGKMAYDREHSSFSELQPGTIDWDRMLKDVDWLNFSAITPALNANLAAVCLEAVQEASKRNITISLDLNYRPRLWKYGKKPIEVIPELVKYCDVVMGNIWSANAMLGTYIDDDIHQKGSRQAYLDHAEATSKEIISLFPRCKTVANTFRFDSEQDNLRYFTSFYENGQAINSEEFTCTGVVDRSGSGDCFMAGIIYGMYHQHPRQQVLDFATAAAFGKLQEQGDATGQSTLMVKKVGNQA